MYYRLVGLGAWLLYWFGLLVGRLVWLGWLERMALAWAWARAWACAWALAVALAWALGLANTNQPIEQPHQPINRVLNNKTILS